MRIQIANLYNAVSGPTTAAPDARAERLQGVPEIASLLNNRMMDNIEYGQEGLRYRRKKYKVRRGTRTRKTMKQEKKLTEDNIDVIATRPLKGP